LLTASDFVNKQVRIHWALSYFKGPWRWYKGVREIHMDKERVGEESKGKEIDGCPLTE
jgi:hypothetical protein